MNLMIMKTFFQTLWQKTWLRNALLLATGLFLGWLLFGGNESPPPAEDMHDHVAEAGTIWTCAMHPQIQRDQPGSCPICGMDLTPLETADVVLLVNQLQMKPGAIKLAEIQTTLVTQAQPSKLLRLSGKIQPDETRMAAVTARFPGRIEQLMVNFTGQTVRKGQVLAKIYSPELLTAQQELFEAIKLKDYSPKLYQAAKNKLLRWDLSEAQIASIEAAGEPLQNMDILSPLSGTVMKRDKAEGDYLSEGMTLLEVVDLSRLWVMFDAYETDLPWIKRGDAISFTIPSQAGETFKGKVSFIDPVIDPQTRVAQLRVEIPNRKRQLKPEMFVQGTIEARMPQLKDAILIPKSAVLWTGERAVVYVKESGFTEPTFSYREIELGQEAGASYVVRSGLAAGEEVASNGVFKIDAAAQLQGKTSMMNPAGGKMPTGHQHQMPASPSPVKTSPAKTVDPAFVHQLDAVYQAYLQVNEALIASDPQAADKTVQQLKKALAAVPMKSLKGEAHTLWMNQLRQIQSGIADFSGTKVLKTQRKAFSAISEGLYAALKHFGVEKEVYYQYCPMAIGDSGAYWLSAQSAIQNPYFGESMLRCGETREQLHPQ
jgi:Cu(I)/Ag(I) efflux system membrane fusion protein